MNDFAGLFTHYNGAGKKAEGIITLSQRLIATNTRYPYGKKKKVQSGTCLLNSRMLFIKSCLFPSVISHPWPPLGGGGDTSDNGTTVGLFN